MKDVNELAKEAVTQECEACELSDALHETAFAFAFASADAATRAICCLLAYLVLTGHDPAEWIAATLKTRRKEYDEDNPKEQPAEPGKVLYLIKREDDD